MFLLITSRTPSVFWKISLFQNLNTLKPCISFDVTILSFEVLPTINLNDDLLFERYEINNVTSDRLLPSELDPIKLSRLQMCPQNPFRFGLSFSEDLGVDQK